MSSRLASPAAAPAPRRSASCCSRARSIAGPRKPKRCSSPPRARTMSRARSARRWPLANGCCATASSTARLLTRAAPARWGSKKILRLHEIGSGGLLPDRTLLLDLPSLDAGSRTFARDQGQLDRMTRKGGSYHEGVDAAFRSLAGHDPDRFRIVNAQGEVEEVTQRACSPRSRICSHDAALRP